jgi:hypothetical protein
VGTEEQQSVIALDVKGASDNFDELYESMSLVQLWRGLLANQLEHFYLRVHTELFIQSVDKAASFAAHLHQGAVALPHEVVDSRLTLGFLAVVSEALEVQVLGVLVVPDFHLSLNL